MDDPLAKFRSPLESLNDVKELGEHTEKIRADLKKVETGRSSISMNQRVPIVQKNILFLRCTGVDHLALI